MVYSIGVIMAQGAKQGFGISGKSGKFKWQDLIGQAAGGFLQKFLGNVFKFEDQGEPEKPPGTEIEWRKPGGKSPLDR